jgi:hypothetical protein
VRNQDTGSINYLTPPGSIVKNACHKGRKAFAILHPGGGIQIVASLLEQKMGSIISEPLRCNFFDGIIILPDNSD